MTVGRGWRLRAVVVCGGLAACSAPSTPPTTPEVRTAAPAAAPPDLPAPTPVPWFDTAVPVHAPSGWLAGTEIRVAWAGADGAPPEVTRSATEARARAEALWRQLADGAAFDALVASASDATSARRDGALGTFRAGTLDAHLEAALASVDVGAVAPLVATAAGVHLLRRDPPAVRRVRWAAFGDRTSRPPHAGRDAAAATAAADAWAATWTQGAPSATPAPVQPDATSAPDGVWIGHDTWSPTMTAAVWDLPVGAVAVLPSPRGALAVQVLAP